MSTEPRVFALEEANALIPELEAFFERIDQKRKRQARLHDELFLEELLSESERERGISISESGLDEEAKQIEKSVLDLEQEILQLRSLGCVIRNLEQGWVDLMGKVSEELVFLSWKRGEKKISFYHPLQGKKEERFRLTGC